MGSYGRRYFQSQAALTPFCKEHPCLSGGFGAMIFLRDGSSCSARAQIYSQEMVFPTVKKLLKSVVITINSI